MEIEDYKEIISLYQQKSFDLFNENIVLKSQISSLSKKNDVLNNNNKILIDKIEKLENVSKELNKPQTPRKKVTNQENSDY